MGGDAYENWKTNERGPAYQPYKAMVSYTHCSDYSCVSPCIHQKFSTEFGNSDSALCDKLGLKNAFAFDLQAACCGFLYLMETAASLIASGRHKKIIIDVYKRQILKRYYPTLLEANAGN